MVESKKDRLQQLLENLIARKPIEQAVIAVESINRSFQCIGIKGKTDEEDEKLTQDTPFFLASIDKMYNAVIVMMLSERGELNIDNKISIYLPDTLIKGLHKLNGVDYSESITVRHLLSHTSGLADWLEESPKNTQYPSPLELKNTKRSIFWIQECAADQLLTSSYLHRSKIGCLSNSLLIKWGLVKHNMVSFPIQVQSISPQLIGLG